MSDQKEQKSLLLIFDEHYSHFQTVLLSLTEERAYVIFYTYHVLSYCQNDLLV